MFTPYKRCNPTNFFKYSMPNSDDVEPDKIRMYEKCNCKIVRKLMKNDGVLLDLKKIRSRLFRI